MDDLMSRQAAIDAIRMLQTYKLYDGDEMLLVDKADVQTELMMLPSAQPERKKGNWIGIDDDPCETFECDVCGFVFDEWIEGDLYNFCPNCGADMREEANDS